MPLFPMLLYIVVVIQQSFLHLTNIDNDEEHTAVILLCCGALPNGIENIASR